MKLHEIFELKISRVFQKLPLWERCATLWGWWFARKCLMYGTCFYMAETLLGHRRRRIGSSPMRHLGLDTWLPKSLDKEMDESTRTFLEYMNYQILEPQVGRQSCVEQSKFYSEVQYPISIKPLPDEEPLPPVEGKQYPPGFHVLMKTLNVFGHFPIDIGFNIWKSSDIISLKPQELLVDIGDVDNYFYVVISGSLSLSIDDTDFGLIKIKSVKATEHIISMFTILNLLLEIQLPPKPIQVIAEEDCVICQVPLAALAEFFLKTQQEEMVPFIRRTLTKIRQVYFEGLNEVAGLNKHLMKNSLSLSHSRYQPFEIDPNDSLMMEKVKKEAVQGLKKYVELQEEDVRECWIEVVDEGTVVSKVAQLQTSLIYIHKGELILINESADSKVQTIEKEMIGNTKFVKFSNRYVPIFCYPEGSVVGSWSILTKSTNFYTSVVPNGQKAVLVKVPEQVLQRVWDRNSANILPIIRRMHSRWSDFSQKMDYCLQWAFITPGKVVYRQGDLNLSTFLVLSGRLRYRVHGSYTYVKRMETEAKSKFGHYEAGDWFGFVECVVAATSMRKTVVADRYSELVMFPAELMSLLHKKFSNVVSTMANYLSARIQRGYNYDEISPPINQTNQVDFLSSPKYALAKRQPVNILAVFPLTKSIPGELYCLEVCRHYPKITKFFTYDSFKSICNNQPGKININELVYWLSPEEVVSGDVGLVVLLGNVNETDLWNTVIARQADFIQILATQECHMDTYDVEKMVESEGWKAIKDFVFLHSAQFKPHPKNPEQPKLFSKLPNGSSRWLSQRPWLDTHHHVRFPKCAFQTMQSPDKKYLDEFESYKKRVGIDRHSDIARMGRWLSNTMVGLVLGGGGAKGAAHIGVLEYLSQLDIPIDYVCGVSIGSFVGGLYALYQDLTIVEACLRKLFTELERPLRYMSDLTIPYSSLFRGRCFDEFVQDSFNDIRIEDLWVPYFCVTTDITGRHSRAHKHGLMWFYIRASMTLTMVFPPLVNPRDSHLLMDGGYSEILPGNHLRANGARYIVASDIGDENGIPLFNIGYECSGIKCVLQNLMPVNHWPFVPSRVSFWEQLNYIAARKYVQLLKKTDRRLVFIRPAVEFYSGKDFHKADEIRLMAYYTTKRRFAGVHRGLSIHMMWSLLNMHESDLLLYRNKNAANEEDDNGDERISYEMQ